MPTVTTGSVASNPTERASFDARDGQVWIALGKDPAASSQQHKNPATTTVVQPKEKTDAAWSGAEAALDRRTSGSVYKRVLAELTSKTLKPPKGSKKSSKAPRGPRGTSPAPRALNHPPWGCAHPAKTAAKPKPSSKPQKENIRPPAAAEAVNSPHPGVNSPPADPNSSPASPPARRYEERALDRTSRGLKRRHLSPLDDANVAPAESSDPQSDDEFTAGDDEFTAEAGEFDDET
eukprot:1124100-Prorocentrum_minimum.AAC.1